MTWPQATYFGQRPHAAMAEDAVQVETPVGQTCYGCDEPILDGERGFIRLYVEVDRTTFKPIHWECELRGALGNPAHLRGYCCCPGREDVAPFTCPRCGSVSVNVNDIGNNYCGNCHDFITEPMTRRQEARLVEKYVVEHDRGGVPF